MQSSRSRAAHGARLGVVVAAVAGVAWTLWGTSELSGVASASVRTTGIVLGAVMGMEALRPRLDAITATELAPPPLVAFRPMFASRSYLVVTVLEVAGIAAGSRVLAATGHADYTIAWVAIVLGLHFLALGRLFFAGFVPLGVALIAAGLVGAAVGGAGGGAEGITATSGLIAAASLFGAGAWTLGSRR